MASQVVSDSFILRTTLGTLVVVIAVVAGAAYQARGYIEAFRAEAVALQYSNLTLKESVRVNTDELKKNTDALYIRVELGERRVRLLEDAVLILTTEGKVNGLHQGGKQP